MKNHINILVTLNEAYIPHLNTMLSSMIYHNQDCFFTVYLLHSSLCEETTAETKRILGDLGELILIEAGEHGLEEAPTTDRFPTEMYYRIFAAKYLPKTVDKVLYLDPDIIVNGSLKELYDISLDKYYFAAASHNGRVMRYINGIRLKMKKEAPYINSGVLLINVSLLRKEQNYGEVFEFIKKNKNRLFLPDQDVISTLYGDKIYRLDTFRFNITERLYKYHCFFGDKKELDWIRNNTVIIHYCGRNKPWKDNYSGKLNVFYEETAERMGVKKTTERSVEYAQNI